VIYLVRDTGSGAEQAIAVATGDFVFVGDVGRPDLLESAAGMRGVMEPSARALFASINEDFKTLPEFVQVWPGHGAGSACGKALGDIPMSTVGYELRTNPSIHAASDESGFVRFILAGQPEPPPYFARMKRENKVGPAVLGTLPAPPPLAAAALSAIAGGADVAVLDTRPRKAFLQGHLPGAMHADLDYQFCTIAGAYVEDQQSIYLVVPEDRVDEAVRGLVRIGLDRIAGYVTPAVLEAYAAGGGRLIATPTIDMAALEQRRLRGDALVLDVRGKAEYDLRHVPGAVNIAHTRLRVMLDQLPKDRPVLVHCNSGGRSAAAVGLLEARGYAVVDVDDLMANYRDSSAPVSTHA
jgi:hydroxyacylglutathione hydrolase